MKRNQDTIDSMVISQIQTDVCYFSFMTAVVVFFSGILFTKINGVELFSKVPLAFLIISTFGFLYPALILANTSSKIVAGKRKEAQKYLDYGYSISEYLGIYLFITAIPLSVNTITTDPFLRAVTLISSVAGLAMYFYMHFSILERHFPKHYKTLAHLIVLFQILLFCSQIYGFLFAPLAIVFILLIISITIASTKGK